MDFNKKIYELNKQKLNYINLDNEIQRETTTSQTVNNKISR